MTSYKHWRNYPANKDCCFITSSIEGFLPLLAEPVNARMVLSALDFYRAKYGFLMHCYVVMREHIHLLLQLEGRIELTKLMADFKRYTSKQMLQWCQDQGRSEWLTFFAERGTVDGEAYSIWQRSFRSVPLESESDALTKARYIHDNPVRKGYVAEASDWPYSSAAAYEGGVTPIGVDVITL